MGFNVKGSAVAQDTAQPLTLVDFGGLVTEWPAPNLPPGCSPLNQEMIFNPAKVGSRPGLKKVFATPIGSATFTYGKTYLDPTNTIRNLYLTSDGILLVQEGGLGAAPSIIGLTTPGSYAKSTTAFGREYIAISDGLRGQEVPLQYDGTNLDRVTQDGPGAPPVVANLSYPPVQMAASSGISLSVVSATTTDLRISGTYGTVTVVVTGGALSVDTSQGFTISGNSDPAFNGIIFQVVSVPNDTVLILDADYPAFHTGTGGTVAINPFTVTRSNNVVTVTTAAPHNLKVGYKAQISGLDPLQIDFIESITINNAALPGQATVKTPDPHGLAPGVVITLNDVPATQQEFGSPLVPVTVSSASRQGQVVTVTTNGFHGLSTGASVTITGSGDASFNGSFFITIIPSANQFCYIQADADATSSGGNLFVNWPLPTIANDNSFEIISTPTPDTFIIELAYADGIWVPSGSPLITGSVSQPWDGIFFVSAVLSPTQFQYQDPGLSALITQVGTVTPYGQISPGKHQVQVVYLTRNFATTRPSPPVTVLSNGGQYLSVSNIPIGPPNVIARILAFTGADGSEFFYIPVVPQENGQVVGTSTQVNDNTTTSVVLDFADPTLFAGISISTMGNDLSSQLIIDSALGFGLYGERLVVYGLRNRIQNMLGMSFDSGIAPSTPNIPTGWNATGTPGIVTIGHYGEGFTFAGADSMSQSFYVDYKGSAIGRGNQLYLFRAWLQAGATVTATITGGSPAFTITATLTATTDGWYEALFDGLTPAQIPTDTIFSVTGLGLVDEMSLIFADNPFLDLVMFGSYRQNPEGIDGVSGKFGPKDDTHKIMCFGTVRTILYVLTRDPGGRIHSIPDNNVTEPAGWDPSQVGVQCGAVSAFGLTESQTDDATGAAGEQWMAWASQACARIFDGGQPQRITQEIQPDWNSINPTAVLTIWALNDTITRRVYFGLPIGTDTAPTVIYPMDYKNLDSGPEIAAAKPVNTIRRSEGAYCRKWTVWRRPMNNAAILYSAPGQSLVVFMGGNGTFPNSGSPPAGGFGNVYYLASQCSDDDYGAFVPFYVTYFFPSPELEAALGLGAQRKLLTYFQFIAQIPDGSSSTSGHVTVEALVNQIGNLWPLNAQYNLVKEQDFDIEWTGASVEGQRIAFKFTWASGSV